MQMLWQQPILALAIGYFLGSIPFGVILTRIAGAGDLRQIGSGNIGATNVLRTGRKGLAAATLLLDLAKGAVAVCLMRMIAPDDAVLAGAAAVLGHLYPIWLRFRGGKGVATLMGVVLALDWRIGALYALVWLGSIAITRISSLGGIIAAVSVPVAALALGRSDLVPMGIGLALIVVWRHNDNIRRLIAGTEPRIGKSKSNASNADD